ncbi:hypothetical protein OFB47_27485, partial [Escherichia coli]|nr:hypothetical protein [Escherichia coli]
FKNIEVEVASLNKQSDTIKQLSTTTANLTLEHDRLSEIYKSLNILSRARVDNAIAEKGAVNALVEEINKLNAAKGTEIESRLVLLAKDAVAAFKALQEASKEAENANSRLEKARQT